MDKNTLTVKNIYDLGDSLTEILKKLEDAKSKGIDVLVLDAHAYDLNDKVLYDAIKYLTKTQPLNEKRLEGIQRAKDKGVRFGRPPKTKELKKARAYVEMQVKAGERPNIKKACELAGITRALYYKHYGKDE
jgi:DNA invertase Pin-like site-specific DNA recombinase